MSSIAWLSDVAYNPLSSSCCEPAGEGTLWVGCGAGREGLGLEICRAGWVANVAPRSDAKLTVAGERLPSSNERLGLILSDLMR